MRVRLASFVWVLALGACSESALKSALYNPESEDAPPANFDSPGPNKEPSTPTVGSGQIPTDSTSPLVSPNPNLSKPTSKTFRPIPSYPNNGMNFVISETDLLLRTLISTHQMTSEFSRQATRAEVIELRLELQTVRSHDEKALLELEGYLVFVLQTPEGLVHVQRFLNEGPVFYTAEGEKDLMSAKFEIRKGLHLEVSMSRLASRSVELAMLNPWQGSLKLVEGDDWVEVAEMMGFVSPL